MGGRYTASLCVLVLQERNKAMNLTEKSAYIKGLADGLNLDTEKPEGKLIAAMMDLISEMAEKLTDLDDEVATLGDYIEEIDEDLGNVEEVLYDECDCDDDECD